MRRLLPALVVTFGLGVSTGQAQPAKPNVEELRQRVAQLEREAARVQADLARARAFLAHVEGKDRLAAEEWRKVVAYCEAEYRKWTAPRGGSWSETDFIEVKGQLAIARAHLAEVERDRDTLLHELPKIIAYHEAMIQVIRDFAEMRVLSQDEARRAEEHHRAELRWPVTLLEATKLQGAERKEPK
jgi:hypothetical protein